MFYTSYFEKMVLLSYISKESINKKTIKKKDIDIIKKIISLLRKKESEFLVKVAVYSKRELDLKLIPYEILIGLLKDNLYKEEVKILIDKLSIAPKDTVEILNRYLKVYGKPIPNYVRLTIAKTITKFSSEELLGCKIKGSMLLKDLIRLTHPKPKDKEQEETFRKILKGKLVEITENNKEEYVKLKGVTGIYYERCFQEKVNMNLRINRKSKITSANIKWSILREAKKEYENVKMPEDINYVIERKDVLCIKKYFKYLIRNNIYLDRLIYITTFFILDLDGTYYIRKYRKYINPNFKVYVVCLRGKGRIHSQSRYIKVLYAPIDKLYKYVKVLNKSEMLKDIEGYIT